MDRNDATSMTLLDRVRARDEQAWSRLVYLYTPLVNWWCQRSGLREDQIDDVRQDVFQAVATGLDRFRRERAGDTFRGWLRGITRNKLLDHYRRRSAQPEAAGGDDAHERLLELGKRDSTVDDDPPGEVARLTHRALEFVRGEFEEKTWQAFWRSAVDGHDTAEIAAELGMSPAGVRKAKSRVLRRLREAMGDLLD